MLRDVVAMIQLDDHTADVAIPSSTGFSHRVTNFVPNRAVPIGITQARYLTERGTEARRLSRPPPGRFKNVCMVVRFDFLFLFVCCERFDIFRPLKKLGSYLSKLRSVEGERYQA